MQTTKHSLLTSVTALLLCFVMLLGTTFAWFTDTATSANNVIKAGNLDIGMYWSSDNANWFNAEAENAPAIFHQDKWEPGYTEVRYIKVTNNGSLSFKYQMAINPTGTVGSLAEVIDVSFDIVTGNDAFVAPTATNKQGSLTKVATLKELIDANGVIAGGVLLPVNETAAGYYSGEIVICVSFHMDELAGNDYQGKSIGSDFGINLYATQFDYENDSFDSSYDDDAEWPGLGLNESASATIDSGNIMLGALTSEVTINGSNVSATIPADVKVADGATSLDLTVKGADGDSNIILGEGESAVGFDVHISGIAADNTQPMIVNLGAVLPMGLTDTELKLYHTENGTPVLMTRVNSAADFTIHNQYTYNAETGEVSIYVASFSVFSAIQTSPDEWDGTSDISWYNESATEFTLTTAEQFAGFRDLVDGGNTFEGKTVKLGVDIDLDGDNKRLFNPIGGGWAYLDGNTFNGTFDGQNHTIYNIYINGWELDATGDQHSETSKGAGLFSSIHNATIKNLAISGAEMVVETTSIGVVVGCAQGVCTFENIVVTKANLGNYQMRNGGIVGDIYITEADSETPRIDGTYTHVFKNVTVDSSVKLSSMWGDFDTGNGGVIGGRYGNTQILMQNVNVACELDVFSDVTAAYQWYAYRRCGMLVGYTGQNSPKQATNAAADFLTCENVNVFYGDWVNYTYYQFANQTDAEGNRLWYSNYPWARAEAGEYNGVLSNVRYGNPVIKGTAINTLELAEANKTDFVQITFDQLYGGGQGVYGTASHEGGGVTRYKTSELATTTVKFQNIEKWDNVKIEYFFAHGDNTWSTLVEGLSATSTTNDGTFDVYTFNIPSIAYSFKITGTKNGADVSTEQFKLSALKANEIYSLYNGELVETRKVTLKSVDTWKVDGARFALYAFDKNNNNIWFNLISSDNANYCCYLPVGYTGAVACRMNGSNTENNWDNKWNQTPNITLPTDGTDYTYTLKLYFKPNSNWTQSSARFAAYFFNDSTGKNVWVNMTDDNGDGVYECEIPSGEWEKMIFCRFNGTSTTNGWNSNMWNQTNDLEYFGEKIYYVWDGVWSNGDGHWDNIVN